MTDEAKDIEHIRNYLNNKLSPAEKAAVEVRMKKDVEFEALFREMNLIIQGIKRYSRQQQLDKLKALESTIKHKNHTPSAKSRSFGYWSIAAAIAFILIGSVIAILFLQAPSGPELYSQYYNPYPNIFESTARSGDDEETSSLSNEAFGAYGSGRYQEAVKYFQLMMEKPDSNEMPKDVILLYLGNSYLAIDSTAAAVKAFSAIEEGSSVDDQALWYKAMAQLKSNDMEIAQLTLEKLAASSGSYAEKARNVLQEID
ncbi:hypothetical protein D770_05490 [Flammeovirgaceae bacterium 311]|nr:hypothetical protein D770_05490 [Flammeovirgaceae bacterium 311]